MRTRGGEGVKKSKHFADIINGSPLVQCWEFKRLTSIDLPSSTSNAGFRHWLRVGMQQRACDCHQVVTRWCAEELDRSGEDEVTWILKDIPRVEYCGPEILRERDMIGTCFKSSCTIQGGNSIEKTNLVRVLA